MNPFLIGFGNLYGYGGQVAPNAQPAPVQQASGSIPTAGDSKSPAIFWVGMVGMLAAIRVVWELAKEK